MMFHYLVYISYDGTNFYGFQKQKKQRTIQEEIEKALSKLNKNKINILYAGRTDSKVHALQNVISFSLNNNFTTSVLLKILNSIFPYDIRATKVIKTRSLINPRFEAKKRVYIYVLYKYYPLPPFLKNYAYELNKTIKEIDFNIIKFNSILSKFEGFHNFKAYTTSLEKRDTHRTIYNIFSYDKGDFIYIYISGKSFLHKMVRSIIGASFNIYLKNMDPELITNSLQNGEKTFIYKVFPPYPLYLKKIVF